MATNPDTSNKTLPEPSSELKSKIEKHVKKLTKTQKEAVAKDNTIIMLEEDEIYLQALRNIYRLDGETAFSPINHTDRILLQIAEADHSDNQ